MEKSILVHGDQEFFCQLLGSFFRENGFLVMKESADIWRTIELIRRDPPCVVLIDARRSKTNGIDDALVIKGEFPDQKVVLLSASSETKDVLLALNQGIDGYLLKSAIPKDIVEDLDSVCKGELRVSRSLVGIVVKNLRIRKGDKCETEGNSTVKLTSRESEILVLISNGHTNKEIAEKLLVSLNTVKNHIISIMKKFNVHTRSGAVSKWKSLN